MNAAAFSPVRTTAGFIPAVPEAGKIHRPLVLARSGGDRGDLGSGVGDRGDLGSDVGCLGVVGGLGCWCSAVGDSCCGLSAAADCCAAKFIFAFLIF